LPTPEFVEAVHNFYTHHVRFRLVAELALCAAACEVIAKLRALGVATLHFIGAQRGRSGAQAMRQIWITKFGPPEVLAFRQAPDPEPKPGEVRIRVEASGVNFADIVGRVGFYPDLPPIPVVPGYEISGRIDAVGAGVDTSWIGRDVLAMTRFGGYADVICVPVRQIFACPPGMSALEAAALPVNYFTAWQLVVIVGGFQFNPMSLISATRASSASIWATFGARWTASAAGASNCSIYGRRASSSRRLREASNSMKQLMLITSSRTAKTSAKFFYCPRADD
jgi:Alcohol dehydrogenase GroES-like domain